jgi:hypothetical protein
MRARTRISALQRAVLALLVFATLARAAAPIARHLHVSTSRSSDVIITLSPFDADSDPMTVQITALPASGALYHLSSNYINFGFEPARGTAISAVPATITDAQVRVVYAAPVGFVSTRFSYTANDGSTTSSAGWVDVTPSHNRTLHSAFLFDAESWTVQTASSTAATWSATSLGALNHFVYRGDIALVVGSVNSARWFFRAPAGFYRNNARVYGGRLSFVLGAFEGDLSANRFADPSTFVMLECSTCASGAGIRLAQRTNSFTGGVQQFSFVLDEAPSSGWLKDPNDDTAAWTAPTQCEFISVLAGLTGLRIYGDFTTEHEVIGLDEVALAAPFPSVAIPNACYS